MSNLIQLPKRQEKKELKVVNVSISPNQKSFLAELFVENLLNPAKLIYEGIDVCAPISEISCSVGPFSETISLKIPICHIGRLDKLSRELNVSRSEIIRRILDRTSRLWAEEKINLKTVKRPFSEAFIKIRKENI